MLFDYVYNAHMIQLCRTRINQESLDYMRDATERARGSSGNEMHFRQYDLIQPFDAEKQVIVQVRDYRQCIVENAPELASDIVVGIDLGGSVSMTCVAAYSLATKRLKTWGAFGDDPPLSVRVKADRMGSLYDRIVREGELRTCPSRITPVIPANDNEAEHGVRLRSLIRW